MNTFTGRPLYVLLLVAGAAIILFSMTGFARMMGWYGGFPGIQTGTRVVNAEVVAKQSRIHARRMCAHCGMITSMREIPFSGDEIHKNAIASGKHVVESETRQPGGRSEIVVLMADGSSRVFEEDHPHNWREGARLIFIDGGSLPD